MKKIIFILPLMLVACSDYKTGKLGANMHPTIDVQPISADIEVGERISGSAECTDLLFFRISEPSRGVYGAGTMETLAKGVDTTCAAGALYDAMSKIDADVIVAPQYTVASTRFMCIPKLNCLYQNTKVLVTGRAGKVSYKK